MCGTMRRVLHGLRATSRWVVAVGRPGDQTEHPEIGLVANMLGHGSIMFRFRMFEKYNC